MHHRREDISGRLGLKHDVLLHLKENSPLTSIVLDSALTKFTPESAEVFFGVKYLTYPPPSA